MNSYIRLIGVLLSLLWLLSAVELQAQDARFTYQGRVRSGNTDFSGMGQFKLAVVTSTNFNHQATAVATRSGQFITIIDVTSGGSGYVIAPTVTISGGGGSGATAHSSISGGSVASITVDSPGSGYTSTPTVTVAPPPPNVLYTTYWSNDGTSVGGSEPSGFVSVPVNNGLFTLVVGDTTIPGMAAIDASVFTQPKLQLRIWFSDGVNGFAPLDPPQNLTTTPYASHADLAGSAQQVTGTISAGQITGTLSSTVIGAGTITSSNLAPGVAAANLAASGLGGVTSGAMVLSSNSVDPNLLSAGYLKFGKIDVGNTWDACATNGSPIGRFAHSAIWTGNEVIIWGGFNGGVFLNDGGRYSPTTNSWTAMQIANAPAGRDFHTAIWTGNEMIVWGGANASIQMNTGGRYTPAADSWTAVNTTNAPSPRTRHTAVWTGTEMMVWGGYNGVNPLNDGARFDPAANSGQGNWAPINNGFTSPPAARFNHTAVWTGTEMIVWGGSGASSNPLNDGARYNPASNTWTAVTTVGAPSARYFHGAVWTGTEMIVWGGSNGSTYLNDGARYNPVSNSWTAITVTGAPAARSNPMPVWTGSEMLVWGGQNASYLGDGGRYNVASNSWSALPSSGAPSPRGNHTAVWTGISMVVSDGFNGGSWLSDSFIYKPPYSLYIYQRP